jgi:tRNA(Ser,Leu) C12 N-acetylase TAN1
MDSLYRQAVDGARERAGGAEKRVLPVDAVLGDEKRPRKEKHALAADKDEKNVSAHKGEKNVPAHRGAFKKHLRKHTLLFQREGGERARAFLITCDQGKEARCIQSGAHLLKLALKALRGESKEDVKGAAACGKGGGEADGAAAEEGVKGADACGGDGGEEDRTAAIEARDRGDDGGRGEETWAVDPGCNGLACITIERQGVDPVDLLSALWDHVDDLGKRNQIKDFYHQHKHCYRFIPLQHFCRADAAEIESTVTRLLPQYFDAAKPTTFSVMCDVRSCSSLKKVDLVHAVAGLVGKEHRVQLYMPDTLIVVQVVKAACGISILKDAHRYLRSQKSTFNLMIHAEGLMKGANSDGKGESAAAETPATVDLK